MDSLDQPPGLADEETASWRGEVAGAELGELPSQVRWATVQVPALIQFYHSSCVGAHTRQQVQFL